MQLAGNTILITGGSSGIGLELSKKLVENNKVLICGRSRQRLENAKELIPALEIFQCDLSDKNQCNSLADWIKEEHPDLNVLINNAAVVHKVNFLGTGGILDMAEQEIAINFMAPVRLIHSLSPILQRNHRATIINITTGLIYAPRAVYPFYNSTKSALHSFTQVLRKQMEGSNLNIIEIMFPAVDTPWHKGNPPKIAISKEKAVDEMLKGLQKGKEEIRIAGANLLYKIARLAPKFAFQKVNSLN
ncbi:SDR family oxidoreductase [Flagellimonas nanhaiensis]|uniref:SDR family NAD(P)-dependent oxidoreductase n=1 Tax=Flagellimonas nanhaiensis TaxID=2292706 RepID=A0A371JT91_9FLAO|nr:SDR family NAD(P)-dependent oxidoreductase [Allomuricauda nanhaiensis]RDY61043.1 SDR family NAD(P)-dependent oxidoreductase [Allomuricauda nanhaiensis]